MSRILIVEDEHLIRREIVKIIREVDNDIGIRYTEYASEAFDLAKSEKIDLFILDIGLKDYSGIELGRQIRNLKKYTITPIIFITSMVDEELEAFRELHSYAFITKPFKKEKVKSTLAPIIEAFKENKKENKLTIRQKEGVYMIPINEVIYIEAQFKRIYIYTLKGNHKIKSYTLNKLMEELDNDFIRVHRSFIVNKNYITKIDRSDCSLHLENTDSYVPISRKYQKDIMRLFQ